MQHDLRNPGDVCRKTRNEPWPADDLLYLIAYHAAPVLEMEKPAVMLTFGNERRGLNDIWRGSRERIPWSEHFQYYELRRSPERTVVLFYNPRLLSDVLREKDSARYLRGCGYRRELTLESALHDLEARFQRECPHEMGLFFGIPLPDVLSFIANGGKQAVTAGYWKVYHNPGPAVALFDRYQEAKRCFVRLMKAGYEPLEYLAGKRLVLTE